MSDIFTLLEDNDEQLTAVTKLHDEALIDNATRRRFKARLKNILENLRSSLDYLAVDITERYGSKKGPVYYPLAQSEKEFRSEIDAKMPGVATATTAVADAIKRWQPYQPGRDWLRHLSMLTREQKHNRLTLQLVREVYQCRVTEKRTGAFVQWRGLRFEDDGVVQTDDGVVHQVRIVSHGGSVELRPEPNRDPNAPRPFWVGESPTVVEVFGVPLDLTTQRPYESNELHVESGQLHQWCFIRPHVAVLDELRWMQSGVVRAITDIAQSADLL